MTNRVVVESEEMRAQRDRFISLALPVRLGELAESLVFATISFDHPKYPEFLTRTLGESIRLIDWTIAEVDSTVQSELAELRSHLTGWLRDAQAIGDDPANRARVVAELREWSQKILDRSGLANYDNWQVEFDYPPGIRAAAEVFV
jgi:hypothetical protein